MADEQATGNALRALRGESLVVNTPFEQVGRLVQAIQNGGGGGGGTPADYNQVKAQVAQNKIDIKALQQSKTEQDTDIAKNAENIDILADAVGVDLSVEYQNLQSNQAVKLTGIKAIDTGLNLDGNAEITAKGGVLEAGKQAILLGAYTSQRERTALKILSGSVKIQSQWASNEEITELNGLDLLQPFEYTQNKNTTQITQGAITLNCVNGGFSGNSDTTKIYLFNQTENGEFNHGFLFYATITHGGTIYEFKPMRKLKDGVDLGVVMLKNSKELNLNCGVLELVEFN